MGKTHDALLRAEAERTARESASPAIVASGPTASERGQWFLRWGHWHPRALAHPDAPTAKPSDSGWDSIESVEALGRQVEGVDRKVGAVDRKIDSLEETFSKRLPEVEARFLHLLEQRVQNLEAELSGSLRLALAERIQPLAQRSAQILAGVCAILVVALIATCR